MKVEKDMLKFSAAGALFFAILGIAWGIVISSSMIMFDGLYSLISLFLSIIAIAITNFIEKSDYEKFPFGKGILEPLTVAFKSIVLIIMCSITFTNAVKEVLGGGNPVDTSLALGYSIVSTVGCAFIYGFMYIKGKKLSSGILKAESNQWLMDTVLSAAVLVGFIISYILGRTSYAYLTKYVDPLMVILTSGIFIRVPILALLDSFKEVVNVNANKEISDEIYSIVKDIEEEYNFEDSYTRVSKIGRELRIEIDFIFNEESNLTDLSEMDKVREELYKNMNSLKFKKWLNVNFTGDKKWAI